MNKNSYLIVVLIVLFKTQFSYCQLLGKEFKGTASFYANMFHGRKTSSGEKLNNKELTVAHRTLPFNTMLEVTNLTTKKTIVVRVNDRGPYNKSRTIDLTNYGATLLGFADIGVAKVKIRIVGMESMILLGKNEKITEMGDIVEEENIQF
jgi:rare lipoprotein A